MVDILKTSKLPEVGIYGKVLDNATLIGLGIVDAKCEICGGDLNDAYNILLRERDEKKRGIWSSRRHRLPLPVHAYCGNKKCAGRFVDIPFTLLLLKKDVVELKANQMKLKEKINELIDLIKGKEGIIDETQEISETE